MVIRFHNPNEPNGYLSNWYLSDFEIDGIKFTSMEQYMMYKKAICFKDKETAREILAATDVGKIKALGRSVKNYNDHYWNGVRQIIVYDGLMAKFSQNEKLKEMLKETGSSILAECAVNDVIWGIGLSMTDPRADDPKKWKGRGLLGYSLMLVREKMYE